MRNRAYLIRLSLIKEINVELERVRQEFEDLQGEDSDADLRTAEFDLTDIYNNFLEDIDNLVSKDIDNLVSKGSLFRG